MLSNTKKFFQKTLQNFKSFFSSGYQRLPKAPPHNNHFSYSVAAANVMNIDNHPNYKDLDKFYTDQWESEKEMAKRRSKKKAVSPSPTKQEKEAFHGSFISLSSASPVQKKNQMEKAEEYNNKDNKRNITHNQKRRQQAVSSNSKGMIEQRNCMVERKLRELELLDMGNVDYILDIEEVLHYYSRLTCPAYLEIVDKFFMEMYSEFFGPARPASATQRGVNSRLQHRSSRS